MQNSLILSTLCLILVPATARSQGIEGVVWFSNWRAPTRMGSVYGPLAGNGVWGQMLIGTSPDSLSPIGPVVQHSSAGILYGGPLDVPGTTPGDTRYVQIRAWDGRLWGGSWEEVPASQFGATDVILTTLLAPSSPLIPPEFTQPAVVPPIPEPTVWALGSLGGALAVLCKRRKPA